MCHHSTARSTSPAIQGLILCAGVKFDCSSCGHLDSSCLLPHLKEVLAAAVSRYYLPWPCRGIRDDCVWQRMIYIEKGVGIRLMGWHGHDGLIVSCMSTGIILQMMRWEKTSGSQKQFIDVLCHYTLKKIDLDCNLYQLSEGGVLTTFICFKHS